MKELELKYGCNPNQKPAKIYHERRKRAPDQSTERQTGIYQLSGCVQRMAAGKGVERGDRTSGGNFF